MLTCWENSEKQRKETQKTPTTANQNKPKLKKTKIATYISVVKPSKFRKPRGLKGRFYGTLTDIQKNGASKSIAHVIKHVNFHLYRSRSDGFISKKLTLTTNI